AWGLAPRMVAPAAAGAPRSPSGVDGAGAGRSWLVGALAVPPHRPPGVASLAAHQSRRQVPPCRAHAVVLAARAGTRRQPAVVRPRDGLCLAGTPGGLYVGSMVGRGVQRPVVSPDGLGPGRLPCGLVWVARLV